MKENGTHADHDLEFSLLLHDIVFLVLSFTDRRPNTTVPANSVKVTRSMGIYIHVYVCMYTCKVAGPPASS